MSSLWEEFPQNIIPKDITECMYEKYVLLSTSMDINGLINLIAQQALFSLDVSPIV
jgi:hypothetical protein